MNIRFLFFPGYKDFYVDCSEKRDYQSSVDYCRNLPWGCYIASFFGEEEIDKVKEYRITAYNAGCTAYIGAEYEGDGQWTYSYDESCYGCDLWLYGKNNGLTGVNGTRIAWHSDGKWHEWGNGEQKIGVICGCHVEVDDTLLHK